MKLKTIVQIVILLSFTFPLPSPAHSQDTPQYQWVELIDVFDNPLYLTHAGDGSDRLFVVEQYGYIMILDQNMQLIPEPFLDITAQMPADVTQGGYTERGLIGLVFHPDYENNGIFFIHYVRYDNKAIIARYHVSADNPNVADPTSGTVLFSADDPFPNHNGGQLAFGPDGYLYIGIGDGGDLGDPLKNGQNTKVPFGKILRIDVNDIEADTYTIPPDNPFVDNPDYLPEIWALGFRNPWRFSFDRLTGDLYIGDVGEATWEEIDFQPVDSPGGENYGWNAYEGNHPFSDTTPIPEDMTLPIFEYSHNEGCSVTGGYVYRGQAVPELQGKYFFGDYCNGGVWITSQAEDGTWVTINQGYLGHQISSFGEDEQGELYMVDYKGPILRLEPVE